MKQDIVDSRKGDYTDQNIGGKEGETKEQEITNNGGTNCENIRRGFGFMPEKIPKIIKFIDSNSVLMDMSNPFKYLQQMHSKIEKFRCPNYKGARIPVPSGLIIPAWREVLQNYEVPVLIQYLQFGFPMGVDYSIFKFQKFAENHKSACQRSEGVSRYFKTEVDKKAMFGPFTKSPFENTHFPPLLARDKPDGGVRVIVDLSWPSDIYDDMPFKLKYPTIDLIVERIKEIGPSAKLFKVDPERAFRNLRVDTYDYPLMGLRCKNDVYVDVGVAFGFKFGSAACQLCTDAITLTLRKRNVWLMNYLDDYLGVAKNYQAESHYLSLVNMLQYVGLPINQRKLEPPSSTINCLGIIINADTGTLTIPDEKIYQIKKLCAQWVSKSVATKNQLQKLVGKLIYIHCCVKPARLFINRILQVLRNAPARGYIALPMGFCKDINWFTRFLEKFNGMVNFYGHEKITHEIFL